MSYDEHRISMAGGDGDGIEAAKIAVAREMEKRTYDRHAYNEDVFQEGVSDIALAAVEAAHPALLALVREQAAKLEAVRELHDFHFQGDAKKCDTCQVSGYALPWPCETVDALEASA